MKLLNEQGTDFSREVLIQLAICLNIVWAAEIICYKVARTLDASGYISSLFQKRKQSFNKARTGLQTIIRDLETAFDGTFDRIVNKVDGKECMTQDYLQGTANDVVELLLIYYMRGDGDQDRKDKMKKALMRFKPVKDFDVDALAEYYKFKW